jgi:N-acetylmuramoyl-L-alanine amidase
LEIPLSITGSRFNRFTFFSFLFLSLFISAAAPREESGTLEPIPLLEVIEYFDLVYKFSSTTGVLSVEHPSSRIVFIVGSKEVYIGEKVLFLDEALELHDGQIEASSEAVDMFIRQVTGRLPYWEYKGEVFSLQQPRSRENAQGARGTPDSSASAAESTGRGRRNERFLEGIGDIGAIVIDAGHGGKDPGGMSPYGIYEKDVVLEVAKELKKELRHRFRGKEILLTRGEDTFLSLEERGRMANSIDPAKNPIFISIHANVSFSPSVRGYETFYLSLDAVGEEAREVASRENSVLDYEIENSGDYISEIINRLVDIEYRRESMILAEYIQNGMEHRVDTESENRGVKGAFFYVLKESKMPAVLVEIGFVTNREEAGLLQQSEYRSRVARGISDGVEEFITAFEKSNGFTRHIEF